MKAVFRLKHPHGTGFIDFPSFYIVMAYCKQPWSIWEAYVLSVNEHGLVMKEQPLTYEDMTCDKLAKIERDIASEIK